MLDSINVVTLRQARLVPGGDRLWTGKPRRRKTRHPGLLSRVRLLWLGCNEYPAKAGE